MAAGRTRRALKRCLCSALPMASVARGTGARRAAPRSRSSGTDIHPMSPLPRWLFLGFNALRQRGMRLASPPSPCPHNRGGCGSAGGRCWGWLEEEQGMGSLCPRPIFCFPWFVQKKNRKDWGFFFSLVVLLWVPMACGVGSPPSPSPLWEGDGGTVHGGILVAWRGCGGPYCPYCSISWHPPSSSITAHCSASSTSSLKHFPFIFILWRGFKSAFSPSKTTRSPDHGSVLSPETPKLGFPWAGAAGREGSAPPWHPHPVLPPVLVPSGPFPSPWDLLACGFSKISPKILQFLPHERFHPSSFFSLQRKPLK